MAPDPRAELPARGRLGAFIDCASFCIFSPSDFTSPYGIVGSRSHRGFFVFWGFRSILVLQPS